MAYKKTDKQIGEIVDDIAILHESARSDWTINLAKISWNGKEPQLEIRQLNKHDEEAPGGIKFGKGVAITSEMADILVEELIRMGYGDSKVIRSELKAR